MREEISAWTAASGSSRLAAREGGVRTEWAVSVAAAQAESFREEELGERGIGAECRGRRWDRGIGSRDEELGDALEIARSAGAPGRDIIIG